MIAVVFLFAIASPAAPLEELRANEAPSSGSLLFSASIDWKTGKVLTGNQFQCGTDAEGLPEIINVCVSATIPANMILAQQSSAHQDLRLHEGEV